MYEYYISSVYSRKNGEHGYNGDILRVNDKIDSKEMLLQVMQMLKEMRKEENICILSFQLLK